jgi:hypothetical protein
MTTDNPFFHRGAIRRAEEFHGREAEISQIIGLCRNGQSVSIVGPRRIGKSSLLLHLRRPATRLAAGMDPSEGLFALLDCQELGGSPPEEVYEAIITSVVDAAESAGIDLGSRERPGTYRSLDRILSAANRKGLSVVVLLDEFELLAANERLTPYFFARLRGLTTKHGISYLTASQRPLFAITADESILSSPFFNIFVTLSLGTFSESEARELLTHRLKGTGYSFPTELCNHLLQLVGLHPFFLHIAGYHAFHALIQERNLPDRWQNFNIDAPIEIEANSHLGYLWQNLTEDEQYCLAVADGPIEILRQLEQQCLLLSTDGVYRYTSEILLRFVRRQPVAGLIQVGPFVIDRQRHQVISGDKDVELTTSQFDLFARLGKQAGQVVQGQELERAVWGRPLKDDPDRLKTLIKRLRRALGTQGAWIVSERGVGYALREPDG